MDFNKYFKNNKKSKNDKSKSQFNENNTQELKSGEKIKVRNKDESHNSNKKHDDHLKSEDNKKLPPRNINKHVSIENNSKNLNLNNYVNRFNYNKNIHGYLLKSAKEFLDASQRPSLSSNIEFNGKPLRDGYIESQLNKIMEKEERENNDAVSKISHNMNAKLKKNLNSNYNISLFDSINIVDRYAEIKNVEQKKAPKGHDFSFGN